MVIEIKFGIYDGKEVISWHGDIQSFPKYLRYQSEVYEFVMFVAEPQNSPIDYIFHFSQTRYYSSTWETIPIFKELFAHCLNINGDNCQCGAKYDKDNKNYHSFWCPKFNKKS